MKKNVIMIALLIMSLCNESQASFAKNWWNRQSREEKQFIKDSGTVIGTLAALWGAALFFSKRFPNTEEAKNINANDAALRFFQDLKREVSILSKSSDELQQLILKDAHDFDSRKIKAIKDNISDIADLTKNNDTINAMLKLIEEIENKIMKDTETNTKALQEMDEARKKRSWKDFLLNRNNPYTRTKQENK